MGDEDVIEEQFSAILTFSRDVQDAINQVCSFITNN